VAVRLLVVPGAIGLELYLRLPPVPEWHVMGVGGLYRKVPCIWSSKTGGRGTEKHGDGYRNVCMRYRRGTGSKKWVVYQGRKVF